MMSRFAPAFRRCASPIALATALAVALAVAATSPQQAAAQTPAPSVAGATPLAREAAAVKKQLEEKFKGASVTSVSKSPYLGLYEVMFDDQLVYTDAKVSYIFVGSVYDAGTKKNLTDAKKRELTRVTFDSLPLHLAFKRVKGNGARRLAVFSDPDCPYCARLERELAGIDDVTIYTFLFPIDNLHPDAGRKARLIWCAPDRLKAWDAFFESGELPKNNGDCDNPVEATAALGQKMRVTATPTLIFADGSVIPGAIPAQRLETEIRNGEAQAARPAPPKK